MELPQVPSSCSSTWKAKLHEIKDMRGKAMPGAQSNRDSCSQSASLRVGQEKPAITKCTTQEQGFGVLEQTLGFFRTEIFMCIGSINAL
jgi:hypothetical protein